MQPSATQFNRVLVNDAQGRALYVKEGTTELEAAGHVQRRMIVNGEVLARYGEISETAPQINTRAVYRDLSDIVLGASPVAGTAGAAPTRYTVVGGETLRTIARAMLGDERMWYLIAEANGLAGSAELVAGQSLLVPSRALSANSVNTFRPYEAGKAIGDLSPALPAPGNNGGCGGFGPIIMLAVAIVVTIYTAGALAGTMGPIASSAAASAGGATAGTVGGTMAAGGAMLSGAGGLGGMAAAAIGGAAGSIASQAVGIAIGAQDSFNWKGVALSALGAGVGAGVGHLAQGTALANSSFGATRAALGNVLAQGIGVVTGLQKKFDWRGVAASAVGAGVGQAVGGAMGMHDLGFKDLSFSHQFGARLVTGLAAGAATAVMRGGRVAIQQVAVDAFGNALGSSLAAAASGTPTTRAQAGTDDPLGDFIAKSNNWAHIDVGPSPALVDHLTSVVSG